MIAMMIDLADEVVGTSAAATEVEGVEDFVVVDEVVDSEEVEVAEEDSEEAAVAMAEVDTNWAAPSLYSKNGRPPIVQITS